jgi:hypothetical protein
MSRLSKSVDMDAFADTHGEFIRAVTTRLESYGWTVTTTEGEGYLIGQVHVECIRDGERFAWGMSWPEIAWRDAYKTLIQPLEGEPHWFDLRTELAEQAA